MIRKIAPVRPNLTPDERSSPCKRCVQRIGSRPVVPPGNFPHLTLTNEIEKAQKKLEDL
jgi:hypothetical protein